MVRKVESKAQLPRHQVVADELVSLIARGTYRLGDRFPTEEELCNRYGLARGTVRQALDRLVQLGMIERRPGSGSRVVAIHPVLRYQPFATAPSDVADLIATTRLIHPETLETRLDRPTAGRVGVRSGTNWHVLRGVRVRRDRPDEALCWSEHYFRELPPSGVTAELGPQALLDLRIEQTVRADLLDECLATVLDAKAGSAALILRRKVFDKRGRVVNVGIYTHPSDRYEITTTVSGS